MKEYTIIFQSANLGNLISQADCFVERFGKKSNPSDIECLFIYEGGKESKIDHKYYGVSIADFVNLDSLRIIKIKDSYDNEKYFFYLNYQKFNRRG